MLDAKHRQAVSVAKDRKGVIRMNADFARNCRYGLTLQEHRIIYYTVLKSQMVKRPFQPITFSVKEFSALCGISETGTYTTLRKLTKKLLSKVVEYVFMDEEKGLTLLQAQWLSAAEYHLKEGTVTIVLNPYVEPIFRKYKQYTETEFAFLCKFSCQYSERLYELLKSLAWDKNPVVDFEIDDLRERLGLKQDGEKKAIDKYPNFKDFRARILDPTMEEINQYTDLDIDFREKRGPHNKVERVIFSVRKKANYIPLADRIAKGEFDKAPDALTEE
jgi:plasmid replication initiation protein